MYLNFWEYVWFREDNSPEGDTVQVESRLEVVVQAGEKTAATTTSSDPIPVLDSFQIKSKILEDFSSK